jgi:hypothetical protein
MTAEASTMVIYSDCTAVGDSASIEQVFAWRRTQVAADVDVLARVKAVKRDGGSRERLQKVREEIETLAKSGAGSNFREESRILDQILAYYELLGWDGVDTLLNRQDVRARRMSQQSYRKE